MSTLPLHIANHYLIGAQRVTVSSCLGKGGSFVGHREIGQTWSTNQLSGGGFKCWQTLGITRAAAISVTQFQNKGGQMVGRPLEVGECAKITSGVECGKTMGYD